VLVNWGFQPPNYVPWYRLEPAELRAVWRYRNSYHHIRNIAIEIRDSRLSNLTPAPIVIIKQCCCGVITVAAFVWFAIELIKWFRLDEQSTKGKTAEEVRERTMELWTSAIFAVFAGAGTAFGACMMGILAGICPPDP